LREKEGARGKESKGKPGRVFERELVVAAPEKRGGKLEEESGGTRGLEGAEMGGDDAVAEAMWLVLEMPSLWLSGEWE
jgi:hypothetical protein